MIRRIHVPLCFVLAVSLLAPALDAGDAKPLSAGRAAGRTFQLNYGATVNDLPAGARVRVWLPVPQTNDHQRIKSLKADLPARGQFNMDAVHGNRILYFETTSPGSGRMAFNTAYLVRRREVQALDGVTNRTRLSAGQEMLILNGHSSYVDSVSFSPDGKRIVSGSGDNTLKVWDAETGQEMFTLKGHSNYVTSVSFSPDGKRIVSGSGDRTLKVWDAETGQEMLTLKGHSSYVNSVSFSPDGKRIVSGGDDQTLKVWDALPLELE